MRYVKEQTVGFISHGKIVPVGRLAAEDQRLPAAEDRDWPGVCGDLPVVGIGIHLHAQIGIPRRRKLYGRLQDRRLQLPIQPDRESDRLPRAVEKVVLKDVLFHVKSPERQS